MKTAALIPLLPFVAAVPGVLDPLADILTSVDDLLSPPINGLLAPILRPLTQDLVPDTYIVKLKVGSTLETVQNVLKQLTGTPSHIYDSDNFKGFAIKLDDVAITLLRALDLVEFIEQDAVVTTTGATTQANAAWGLARISSKTKGATSYTYDVSAGDGTCSYVIDSGIYTDHSDFGGRATWLANFIDGDNTDGNGHGTHVAGTIGGTTYGVAKKTKLYAVKVLNAGGGGTISSVIGGLDFVAKDAKTRKCPNGAVANMSIGGGLSAALNSATKSLVDAGVFVAVAAGNNNQDATNFSPASEPSACTVGATTSNDEKAGFSNYGSPVDIHAPGQDILSAGNSGTTSSRTMSGTSMASPHIAGLAAYLLSTGGKKTPDALCTAIKNLSTKNAITGLPAGTVNQLAYNGGQSTNPLKSLLLLLL